MAMDESADTDGGGVAVPHDFRVPRVLRAAEVLCADGRRIPGRVFLPASAVSHAGVARADEWMNEPAEFFPFLPDGEGSPVILNKGDILALTVAASADHDAVAEQVGAPVRRVMVECGGQSLVGEVLIDLPADHSRVLDLLNRPEPFLTLRDGDHHHLVRKSRISRVREVPRIP